jgi:hypothetical protein
MPSPINDPTAAADAIAASVSIVWDSLIQRLKVIFGEMRDAAASDVLAILNVTEGDVFARVARSTLEDASARAAELVGKRVLEDGTIVDNPNPEFAITESTRRMLHDLLVRALAAGQSPGALRDSIVNDYVFSARRALNIARTERAFAQNRGALTAARASGVVTGKRSVLASEHPQEDECDDAAADGVIPIDQDFSPGGDPPFHPSCACDLEFTTEPLDG